jgi:hypothetical protein
MAANCPKNGQKRFLATLGAVSRAEDLLATIVFSRRRAKGFFGRNFLKTQQIFPSLLKHRKTNLRTQI